MKQADRTFRLQLEVPNDEMRAIEDFRFRERLPSKSAAVRSATARAGESQRRLKLRRPQFILLRSF